MSGLTEDDRARRRASARSAQTRRRRGGLVGALALLALGLLITVVLALTAGGGGHSPRTTSGSPRATPATPATGGPTSSGVVKGGTYAAGSPPASTAAVPGLATVRLHGPAKAEIALTFDDGFCPACVARIIRTLARTGAHATIFPNGVYRTAWEPVAGEVRHLVALGQLTIGDHTYLHHDAVLESSGAFSLDLAHDERWIEQTFGVTARPFFRPPYGAFNSGTLQIAGQQGFTKVVNWSGTLADSSPRSIPYLLHAIRYWARPGAIILAHGNYPNTSIALPQILAILQARGLKPVTLSELLGRRP